MVPFVLLTFPRFKTKPKEEDTKNEIDNLNKQFKEKEKKYNVALQAIQMDLDNLSEQNKQLKEQAKIVGMVDFVFLTTLTREFASS